MVHGWHRGSCILTGVVVIHSWHLFSISTKWLVSASVGYTPYVSEFSFRTHLILCTATPCTFVEGLFHVQYHLGLLKIILEEVLDSAVPNNLNNGALHINSHSEHLMHP